MKKILITGASGFVGSFLVAECLKREKLNVFAGVRATSNRTYLQDERIHFFEMDFNDIPNLEKQLKKERFDFIIHNAGIVAAPKNEDYFRVNYTLTKNFVNALVEADSVPEKFTYISSLSAYGPADSNDLSDFVKEEDQPHPLTSYGKSKLAAEQFLRKQELFPSIIIRPTVVYGPREKELLTFFKYINRGWEPYVGFKKQHLTFIYVKDLARAVIDAAISGSIVHKAYFLSDGQFYTPQGLSKIARQILKKKTFKFYVPIGLTRLVAFLMETTGKMSGRFPILNLEKVDELESRNWKCDFQPLWDDIRFRPQYDLESGLRETLLWYKKNNWL